MKKSLHFRSFFETTPWHKTLRKTLHFHSFSSPPSCTFLGPNLPDVWIPKENNTSPHTLLPQSFQWSNDGHSARIIEGKPIAKQIKLKVADEIRKMKSEIGKFPRLAVVLVGDRKDSHTFIHVKMKACDKVGIGTVVSELPESCTENELLDVVSGFNDDDDVHGIVVQLPLPQVVCSYNFYILLIVIIVVVYHLRIRIRLNLTRAKLVITGL
ncbi:Bifunctional protein FolD 1 [Lathyrus oleraceus]|uniref:Bifunctional protein FolD 1 n=1 Tax=Pisum sativum TaxID=3888 RepID=A0A9D4WZ25_PEA|nr:Bifunctional protein FolD 1 [Pisum sativum]